MKNENVVYCPPCGESTLKGGKGVVNKEILMDNPPSALRATSPAGGEVNGGFTLIELLVVVLIIGILAAVALPQYKVAVVKSRIAAILPIVDTLRKASIVYYMAHGKYTTSISELDVDIPCTESVRMEDNMPFWKCGNDFLVQVNVRSIFANYCPNHNSSYETCKEVRDIQLGFPYKEGAERYCLVLNNSSLGERVCKALGKDIGSGKYIIP